MTDLTAVQLQAYVVDGRGVHTYRAYGRSRYEARKALYAAAKTMGMRVMKDTFMYRFEDINDQISYPNNQLHPVSS
jgi:hypothetical protein